MANSVDSDQSDQSLLFAYVTSQNFWCKKFFGHLPYICFITLLLIILLNAYITLSSDL